MIRGKKNYLPPCQLVMGFGFLFKLTDECVEKHKNERARRTLGENEDDRAPAVEEVTKKLEEDIPIVSSEDELDDEDQFPDTHVDICVDNATNKIKLRTMSETSQDAVNKEETEDTFVVSSGLPRSLPSAQKIKNQNKKKATGKFL